MTHVDDIIYSSMLGLKIAIATFPEYTKPRVDRVSRVSRSKPEKANDASTNGNALEQDNL